MNDTDEGYSITEQVFDRREMARIREALMGAELVRTNAGARHVLQVPAIRTLASHPALVNLAAMFVCTQAIPFRATLFDKSAVSNWLLTWHQDTALPIHQRVDHSLWGPLSLKGGVLHAIAPGPPRWRWWSRSVCTSTIPPSPMALSGSSRARMSAESIRTKTFSDLRTSSRQWSACPRQGGGLR